MHNAVYDHNKLNVFPSSAAMPGLDWRNNSRKLAIDSPPMDTSHGDGPPLLLEPRPVGPYTVLRVDISSTIPP